MFRLRNEGVRACKQCNTVHRARQECSRRRIIKRAVVVCVVAEGEFVKMLNLVNIKDIIQD